MLFGTGMGTAFQMVRAMCSGPARVAAGDVVADWVFTTPAGLIQPLTGLWLIHQAGYSLTEPRLLAVHALYALAFVCWAPVVHLQLRIRDLCRAATGPALPAQAVRLYRIWFALGWPAFAALVVIFWLMVSRPDFM